MDAGERGDGRSGPDRDPEAGRSRLARGGPALSSRLKSLMPGTGAGSRQEPRHRPRIPQRRSGPTLESLAQSFQEPIWRLSLVGLALLVLAIVYTLILGRALLVPVTAALFLHALLSPAVRKASARGVPPGIAAGLIFAGLVALLSTAAWQLTRPALNLVEGAPGTLERAEYRLREFIRPVEEAREAVDAIAGESEEDQVTVAPPSLSSRIVTRAGSALAGLGAALILLLFLLATRGQLLRKAIGTLPAFGDRRRALVITRHIQRDLSRYLVTKTAINATLGAAVGLAMWGTGLPNPALWGVVAGLLNFVPFVGGLVGVALIAMVSLANQESVPGALLSPLCYLALNTLEAQILTPWIMGRRFRMSPVLVFLSVLFWGSIWGVAGALMAVPILTTVAIVSRHVDALRPMSRVLEG